MTNVFYTWLGPTQEATKEVSGFDERQRPDLFGILQAYGSKFTNNPPPNFTLCVLKKFKSDFEEALPDEVDVLAVDEVLANTNNTAGMSSIIMTEPNLDNIDLTVEYIIDNTLGVRGTGYDKSALPYKKLAFIKDLWSIYCVWKFGGYHLDSGMFPYPTGSTLSFADPEHFDVPTFDAGDCRTSYYAEAEFSTGDPMTIALKSGSTLFEAEVMVDRITRDQQTPLKRLIDVWAMRSPQGDSGAYLALLTYVRLWFEARNAAKKSGKGYKARALSRDSCNRCHDRGHT